MRIVIGSLNFPDAGRTLAGLLPEDQVIPCPEADLATECASAEVLIPTMARVGEEIIKGSGLRLIQQWGVGLEGVDLAAATAQGIAVCNVPADSAQANAVSTAEQAIFLMMASARRFHQAQASLRQGPWGSPQGVALLDCNALVVGLGRVGSALAARLKSLGMRVSGVKATPRREIKEQLGLEELGGPDDLLSLLPQADFVASALVATPQTLGIFNHKTFAAMKPGAFFVNVSRGNVVDEAALKAALDEGHLAGAGLDVFAAEPVAAENPLLSHPLVVAMPHVGGVTRQSFAQIGKEVAANVRRLKEGKPLAHQAN